MSKRHPTLLISALGLGLVACQAAPGPDTETPYYENAELGFEITDFADWSESVTREADGSVHTEATARVWIEGQGTHEVEASMTIASPSQGGEQTVTVHDLDNGDMRWYRHEPDNRALVLGDDDGGVYVFANDDGSFEVVSAGAEDGTPQTVASDGYAAYRLVAQQMGFDADARFNLVLAYAIAHGPTVETRASGEFGNPPIAAGRTTFDLVTPGTRAGVCDTFRAICDCLACEYVGQGEGCGQCQ